MREIQLDQVAIDTPCPMKWADLDGDDKQRFCDECSLHVLNLSAMTRTEAEDVLTREASSGQRVCVTLQRDASGAIVSTPERPRFHRLRAFAGAVASVLFGFVPFLGACKQTVGDVTVDPSVDPGGETPCTTELLGEMMLPEDQLVPVSDDVGRELGRMVAPQPADGCTLPMPEPLEGPDELPND
jgi:hypothetical protein